MKTLFKLLAIALLLISSLIPLLAQDGSSTTPLAAAETIPWQLALIPILTPIIIAAVKFLAPKIPRVLLPILAPILGAAIDLASHFAAGTGLNLYLALFLGCAGVGIRELYDQVKKQTGAST